ncbi:MAG: helix-turn-helix domain-containing protein [Oscillospiraceae bacterium]|nr:helix-turn-helix domain-containing protein [Oscillospiraceae bacterium]
MDAEYTGTQIAACRKARGMTQKALAERLHVTDKAVSKWERGLNFPDLTLIEPLAEALDTTPAALLGLEHAQQEEIVTSMTELSGEQLEDARRDNSRTGWGCLVLALVLMLVYHLFGGKDVVSRQRAYQFLHCAIVVISLYGVSLLFKYRQIRTFAFADYMILYSGVLAVLIDMGYMFITGYGSPVWLHVFSVGTASCCTQWLFLRVMAPRLIKLLPVLLSLIFALWHLWIGNTFILMLLPFFCCLIICLLFLSKGKNA